METAPSLIKKSERVRSNGRVERKRPISLGVITKEDFQKRVSNYFLKQGVEKKIPHRESQSRGKERRARVRREREPSPFQEESKEKQYDFYTKFPAPVFSIPGETCSKRPMGTASPEGSK